jgi:ribosomal protein S12 methylthiotransferase accessory factor
MYLYGEISLCGQVHISHLTRRAYFLRYDACMFEDITRRIRRLRVIRHVQKSMRSAGILDRIELQRPDFNYSFSWLVNARYRTAGGVKVASGQSFRSSSDALLKALGETTERLVWLDAQDYFLESVTSTFSDIASTRPAVSPEIFSGFSTTQRAQNSGLTLRDSDRYLWIQGYSHVLKKTVWLPAQTVSGAYNRRRDDGTVEPLLRASTSCGVAAHETNTSAIRSGILELIERDAFMVMWLNQLTLPRIDLTALQMRSRRVADIIDSCMRRGITLHCISLITDAPAHALCVVAESTHIPPQYSFGLRSDSNFETAFESAALEALRGRYAVRYFGSLPENEVPQDIRDHLLHWASPEHSSSLSFLIHGPIRAEPNAPWEGESAELHLNRLIDWCSDKSYECISVDLSNSRKNYSPWRVHSVVIPQLHPYYIRESLPHLWSKRLTEIPLAFGYTPRETPFRDSPHPFW